MGKNIQLNCAETIIYMASFFYKLFRRMNGKMRQTIFNKMIWGNQDILIPTYYQYLYKKMAGSS